jgi:hypothetical protein
VRPLYIGSARGHLAADVSMLPLCQAALGVSLQEHPFRELSESVLQALTNSTCWVATSVSKARNRSSGVL